MDPYFNLDNSGEPHLPPGFRFHPTDEELITYYLLKKVLDSSFTGRAIAEVDLNKCEPWELPEKAKMGEKEWYFFSLRDRKYPTGLRTNRATEAGYWKATGKDREIYSFKTGALVGMKKTLVFYKGRAPKGEKSNWVMHEYRLEGKFAYHFLSRSAKDEWVISRVFQKSGLLGGNGSSGGGAGGKKMKTAPAVAAMYPEPSSPSSVSLPPLMDSTATAASFEGSSSSVSHAEHVSCFSIVNAMSASSSCFDMTPMPHPSLPASSLHHNSPSGGLDPFARFFPRNDINVSSSSGSVGLNAFPNLRSLQENLHLPFFANAFTPAVSLQPPFHGGDMMLGGEEGGRKTIMAHSELDCVWNIY